MSTVGSSVSTGPDAKRLSVVASLICLAFFALAYITNAMDRQIFPMLLPWISKTYGFNLKDATQVKSIIVKTASDQFDWFDGSSVEKRYS